jgi:hypothetical protein
MESANKRQRRGGLTKDESLEIEMLPVLETALRLGIPRLPPVGLPPLVSIVNKNWDFGKACYTSRSKLSYPCIDAGRFFDFQLLLKTSITVHPRAHILPLFRFTL